MECDFISPCNNRDILLEPIFACIFSLQSLFHMFLRHQWFDAMLRQSPQAISETRFFFNPYPIPHYFFKSISVTSKKIQPTSITFLLSYIHDHKKYSCYIHDFFQNQAISMTNIKRKKKLATSVTTLFF